MRKGSLNEKGNKICNSWHRACGNYSGRYFFRDVCRRKVRKQKHRSFLGDCNRIFRLGVQNNSSYGQKTVKPNLFCVLTATLAYQIAGAVGGNTQATGFLLGFGLICVSALLNMLIFWVSKKSVAYMVLLIVFKFVLVLIGLWVVFSKNYLKGKLVSGAITDMEIKWFVVGLVFSIFMLSIFSKTFQKNKSNKQVVVD